MITHFLVSGEARAGVNTHTHTYRQNSHKKHLKCGIVFYERAKVDRDLGEPQEQVYMDIVGK